MSLVGSMWESIRQRRLPPFDHLVAQPVGKGKTRGTLTPHAVQDHAVRPWRMSEDAPRQKRATYETYVA